MDTNTVRKEIVKKIDQINDPRILENLDFIIDDLLAKSHGKDFWDDLPDSLKSGIERAEQDFNNGKVIPHEEVFCDLKNKYSV